MKNTVLFGDCLLELRKMPSDSVDLVFCSPPYEGARDYGIGFKLAGQDWVNWALPRYIECVRICRGLVAWVVEGRTKKFRYSATPALLMADLVRSKIRLRKPPIFHRVGIPGSGGPDWLRSDSELIVCASKGRLPWSDNTAMGKPCKYESGGAMSNRMEDGRRRNHKTGKRLLGDNGRPDIANPGNVIRCAPSTSEIISLVLEFINATRSSPEETVQALQESIRQKTIFEWFMGVTQVVHGSRLLLSAMHGRGLGESSIEETDGGPRTVHGAEVVCGEEVPNVRKEEGIDSSPRGRKSAKQLGSKRQDTLPEVPQPSAQCDASQEGVHGVRENASLVRIVRDALLPLQDAWRSVDEAAEYSLGRGHESGDLMTHVVGGGVMGNRLCHENEAPFPESLAEFFIRSFCRPGGIVVDPFCGSGTTLAMAERWGRKWIGIECRQSQVDLSLERIAQERSQKEEPHANTTKKSSRTNSPRTS